MAGLLTPMQRLAGMQGVARWAAAVVPLGVAASALAAGAFGHPHVIASHPVTPCTAHLQWPDRLPAVLHSG